MLRSWGLFKDPLHSSHLAAGEPDLDAVGMGGRPREDGLDHTLGQLPGPLVPLLDHGHLQAGSEVLTLYGVHEIVLV